MRPARRQRAAIPPTTLPAMMPVEVGVEWEDGFVVLEEVVVFETAREPWGESYC